jgi:hypothetical protein
VVVLLEFVFDDDAELYRGFLFSRRFQDAPLASASANAAAVILPSAFSR